MRMLHAWGERVHEPCQIRSTYSVPRRPQTEAGRPQGRARTRGQFGALLRECNGRTLAAGRIGQALGQQEACARLLLSLVTRARAGNDEPLDEPRGGRGGGAPGRGNGGPPDGGGDTRPRGGPHAGFATKDWGTPVRIPAAVQANIDALYGLTAVKAFKEAEGKAK